jgi:methylenetetrahydrofolate reductase (NADPH)
MAAMLGILDAVLLASPCDVPAGEPWTAPDPEMKIVDKLKRQSPAFSFEFFPPKDDEGKARLFETVADLRGYEPAYVSVTYGAGGSTRRMTVDLVCQIKADTGIETMAHLTCVGAAREEIASVLDQLRDCGIQNVLALRGDPPRGSDTFVPTAGGFAHASELVEFIRKRWNFCIAGACYPEKHPEAENAAADLEHLVEKATAGTDFLITQLFFDNRDYFEFVARARAAGIQQKIIAGIMPITNASQVKRFTAMCGARIPTELLAKLDAVDGNAEAVRAIGVEHATQQCRELIDRGAPGIHFYPLNRSTATVQVLRALR